MKNKILTIGIILFGVGAFLSLAIAVYISYHFITSYRSVITSKVTQEEVLVLEEEVQKLSKNLSDKKTELQMLEERSTTLLAVENMDYEEKIRNCYIAKKEAENAARSLVMGKLQNTSYIMLGGVKDEELGSIIGDMIIDEASDNAIISSGVKSAITAASEEMSLYSIINGAFEGAVEVIPDYIKDEITGKVSDVLGADVIGAAEWVSEFMNVDDTPVALANNMVYEQQNDIASVITILDQEEMTAGDMQYILGILLRIRARDEELVAAGSYAGVDLTGIEQLEDLARTWEKNNYLILQYAKQEGNVYED